METFKGNIIISGIFTNFSGLNIGSDGTGSGNKGIAKLIIRHPITYKPFIPGSSFRGAVHAVLSRVNFHKLEEAHFTQNIYEKCDICRIFGTPSTYFKNITKYYLPRVIFRDVHLHEDTLNYLKESKSAYLTEIRVYAGMDRITSQGNSYAIEEIPPGSWFNFEIIFSIYDEEDKKKYLLTFLKGLSLLEKEFIGSHGSRGLGKIRFGKWGLDKDTMCLSNEIEEGLEFKWRDINYYKGDSKEDILIFKKEDKLTIEDIISQYNKIEETIKV